MTSKMKRLMLMAGLITALATATIMYSAKESSASVDISFRYDKAMVQQVVVQKGTQWVMQSATNLLKLN